MQKLSRLILFFAIVYLSTCLILFPKEAIEVGKDAVSLCLNSVIPTLFPYLVASGYLSASGIASSFSRYLSPFMRPLFGVSGSGSITLVLGTVSGYPIGAVCASDLYQSGECTKSEAEKLLAFCNNSGPLFIMSVVGCGFLNSPHLGRILYVSHVFAAILTGIILRSYNPSSGQVQKALPKPLSLNTKNTLQIFGGVMDNSVFTILKICGFIIFFTVFSKSLPVCSLSPIFHAFLEITGGIRDIVSLEINFDTKLCLISFFIAFSGISVLFQVGAIASKSGLSLKPYILGKLLQGVFSALLTKILISKLPQTVDVFTKNAVGTESILPYSEFLSSVSMLCFGLILLSILLVCAIFRQRHRN